jgi:hypothetical protein
MIPKSPFLKLTYMARIGRILPIKKEYSKSSISLEACLAEKGYTRFPSTTMKLVPFKEANGRFRTGLDENAIYIRKLPAEAQEAEKKFASTRREELEELTGLDLSALSPYYKEMFNSNLDQSARAALIDLKDEENIFNLDNPYEAITYYWLRVHPQVAPSWSAWERGDCPASIKFYVADEQVEAEISYRKKTAANKAVVVLDNMSVEDRKKVARLLGLPVGENTKEVYVYNLLDTYIKSSEVTDGKHRGADPLTLFNRIVNLDPKMLGIRDLIEQAIRNSIYREDNDGTIKEAGQEIAKSAIDLATDLSKSKNQDKLLALTEKVKAKKLAQ